MKILTNMKILTRIFLEKTQPWMLQRAEVTQEGITDEICLLRAQSQVKNRTQLFGRDPPCDPTGETEKNKKGNIISSCATT